MPSAMTSGLKPSAKAAIVAAAMYETADSPATKVARSKLVLL